MDDHKLHLNKRRKTVSPDTTYSPTSQQMEEYSSDSISLHSPEKLERHHMKLFTPACQARQVKVNRSRERQQNELVTLREEVQTLQNEVYRLKSTQRDRRALTTTNHKQSVWQQLAQQQIDEAKGAKLENIELRATLQRCLDLSHILERVLHQPLTMPVSGDRHPIMRKSRFALTGVKEFEKKRAMMQRLFQNITAIDKIMQLHGLMDRVPILEVSMKRLPIDKLVITCSAACTFPYPMEQVMTAYWNQLGLHNKNYGDATQNPMVVATEAYMRLLTGQVERHILGNIVGYRERRSATSGIIIFEFLSDFVVFLTGGRMANQETKWITFESVIIPSDTDNTGTVSTIVRACDVMSLIEYDTLGVSVRIPDAKAEQIIQIYKINERTGHQRLENLLLQGGSLDGMQIFTLP